MKSPFDNNSLPLNHRKPWDDLTEDYRIKIRKVHYDNILLNSNHNQFQITAVNSNVVSNSGLVQPNEPAVKPAVDESSSIPCNFIDCNENQQSFNNINNNNNNNNNYNFADGNNINDNDNNDNNDNSNTNNNHSDKKLVNESASENVQIIDRTFSFDEQAFQNNFAKCLVNNCINHTQTKAFLDVLRTHPSLTFLPKDSRSLMKTSRKKILTKIVPPGEYLHIGLEFKLHSILSHVSIESIPTELVIDFSTDGADLNKKIQIWPIQIRITNLPFYDDPEHVGIYQGHSKPRSFEEFFDDFITEAENIIKKGGIKFNNMIIPIRFRCFIGDAPARAAVLNHVSHVAKTSCSKCTVEGITSTRSSRFPGVNYQCRSYEKYRNLTDVDHHINVSSIRKLPINLVEQVPFEYMHLVCLGVTKKLVETVVFGKCKPNKLQQFEIDFLANRLLTLQNYCPREFARIPRELDKIHTFKATEFQQLLLYTFIIASSGIIQNDHYNNFLLLHASIRILLNNSSSVEDLDFADKALKKFVIDSENLYGLEFITYNVHGLLHLVDDYRLHGSLHGISAFTYENSIRQSRLLVKKPNQLLQQIYKRSTEQNHFQKDNKKNKLNKPFKAYGIHNNGPISDLFNKNSVQYENLKIATFFYSIYTTDNTIIDKNNRIGIISNIIKHNNEYFIAVRFFKSVEPLYQVLDRLSPNFGVYKCSLLEKTISVILIKEIKTKCYRMPVWVKKNLNPHVNDKQLNNAFCVIEMLE